MCVHRQKSVYYTIKDLRAECKLLEVGVKVRGKELVELEVEDALPHQMPHHVRQLVIRSKGGMVPPGLSEYRRIESLDISGPVSSFADDLWGLELRSFRLRGEGPLDLPALPKALEIIITGFNFELPHELGHLPLERLILTECTIPVLPPSIGEISSLQSLNVSAGLRDIPDEIGTLPSLLILDLSSNALTALPESVGRCSSIRVLNLSHNNLGESPEVSRAQHLSLDHNQLQVIDFAGLENLVHLSAANNQISELRNMWGGRKIQDLNLADNHIKSLPDEIAAMTHLRILDISGNQVQRLPKLPRRLARLYCRNNPLQDLNKDNVKWFRNNQSDIRPFS